MSQDIDDRINYALSRISYKDPRFTVLYLRIGKVYDIMFRSIGLNQIDVGLPDSVPPNLIIPKISLDVLMLRFIIGPNGEYFDRIGKYFARGVIDGLFYLRWHFIIMTKEEYEEEIFLAQGSNLEPVIRSHVKDAVISFQTAADIIHESGFNVNMIDQMIHVIKRLPTKRSSFRPELFRSQHQQPSPRSTPDVPAQPPSLRSTRSSQRPTPSTRQTPAVSAQPSSFRPTPGVPAPTPSTPISNHIDRALSRMLVECPRLIDLNSRIIKFRGDCNREGISLTQRDVGLPASASWELINLKISLDIIILCSIIGPNGKYFDRTRDRLPDFRCHYALMLKEECEEIIFLAPESALEHAIKSHLKDALISFETAEDITRNLGFDGNTTHQIMCKIERLPLPQPTPTAPTQPPSTQQTSSVSAPTPLPQPIPDVSSQPPSPQQTPAPQPIPDVSAQPPSPSQISSSIQPTALYIQHVVLFRHALLYNHANVFCYVELVHHDVRTLLTPEVCRELTSILNKLSELSYFEAICDWLVSISANTTCTIGVILGRPAIIYEEIISRTFINIFQILLLYVQMESSKSSALKFLRCVSNNELSELCCYFAIFSSQPKVDTSSETPAIYMCFPTKSNRPIYKAEYFFFWMSAKKIIDVKIAISVLEKIGWYELTQRPVPSQKPIERKSRFVQPPNPAQSEQIFEQPPTPAEPEPRSVMFPEFAEP